MFNYPMAMMMQFTSTMFGRAYSYSRKWRRFDRTRIQFVGYIAAGEMGYVVRPQAFKNVRDFVRFLRNKTGTVFGTISPGDLKL